MKRSEGRLIRDQIVERERGSGMRVGGEFGQGLDEVVLLVRGGALTGVVIGSSRQGVRHRGLASGSIEDLYPELCQKFDPSSLARRELVSFHPVGEVEVIGQNLGVYLDKHMSSSLERSDDRQKLLLEGRVVELCLVEGSGFDSNRMLETRVGVDLRYDVSPSEMRGIGLEDTREVWVEVSNGWGRGQLLFESVKGSLLISSPFEDSILLSERRDGTGDLREVCYEATVVADEADG